MCILCLNAVFVRTVCNKVSSIVCVWRQPNYARLIWWRDGQMVTKPAIDVIQALWHRPASTTSLAWLTADRNHSLTHSLIHNDDSINTTVHKNSTFRFTPWIVSVFYFSIFLFFVFVIYLIVSLVFFLAIFIRLVACFYSLSLCFFLIFFSSSLFLCASHFIAVLFTRFTWCNARCPYSAEINLVSSIQGMNR